MEMSMKTTWQVIQFTSYLCAACAELAQIFWSDLTLCLRMHWVKPRWCKVSLWTLLFSDLEVGQLAIKILPAWRFCRLVYKNFLWQRTVSVLCWVWWSIGRPCDVLEEYVGCGRPGKKCTLKQCMTEECPSAAGGNDAGCKCSAVPPLGFSGSDSTVEGERLWLKSGGYEEKACVSVISIVQAVSPALPTEGMG